MFVPDVPGVDVGNLLTLVLGWSVGTGCTLTMLTGIALLRIRWGRSECWVWVGLGGAKICWTLRSNSDKVWGFNFLPKFRLAHSFALIEVIYSYILYIYK